MRPIMLNPSPLYIRMMELQTRAESLKAGLQYLIAAKIERAELYQENANAQEAIADEMAKLLKGVVNAIKQ